MFCTYFLGEWLFRFLALKRKRDMVFGQWRFFETVLVVATVFETWALAFLLLYGGGGGPGGGSGGSMSMVRMVRLLRPFRMGRVGRLIRAQPELLILLKGLCAAARPVLFTLIIL